MKAPHLYQLQRSRASLQILLYQEVILLTMFTTPSCAYPSVSQIIAGHTFPSITPANEGNQSVEHISTAGAIRLAKAQWWLLSRIAGWDGK